MNYFDFKIQIYSILIPTNVELQLMSPALEDVDAFANLLYLSICVKIIATSTASMLQIISLFFKIKNK